MRYNQVIWEQPTESSLDAWVLCVFKTQPEKHLLLSERGHNAGAEYVTLQSTAVAFTSQLAFQEDR